jgi:hypothetical protein
MNEHKVKKLWDYIIKIDISCWNCGEYTENRDYIDCISYDLLDTFEEITGYRPIYKGKNDKWELIRTSP